VSPNELRMVSFREQNRKFGCLVPKDALWTAVKDVLLLREYERRGCDLSNYRGTVVDAGAHVGLFSLRASVFAKCVVALEPSFENFRTLKFNLEINLIDAETNPFCPLNAALWTKKGVIGFTEGSHSAGGVVADRSPKSGTVDSLALEDVVAGWGDIHLLKLDIEGAEFPILQSASRDVLRRIDAIVGEIHLGADRNRLQDLEERLNDAGFEVLWLEPPVREWRQSVMRVLQSWRTVEGLIGLKLGVIGAYSLFAIGNRLLNLEDRLNTDSLCYLFARR
jgi:FkbM family methyltransferase